MESFVYYSFMYSTLTALIHVHYVHEETAEPDLIILLKPWSIRIWNLGRFWSEKINLHWREKCVAVSALLQKVLSTVFHKLKYHQINQECTGSLFALACCQTRKDSKISYTTKYCPVGHLRPLVWFCAAHNSNLRMYHLGLQARRCTLLKNVWLFLFIFIHTVVICLSRGFHTLPPSAHDKWKTAK